MEIVFRKDISSQQWNNYVAELHDASFLYTSLAIDYYQTYSQYIVEDLSFVMLNNKKCRVCAPLFLEEKDGLRIFASGGSFGPAPLVALDERYKICERLMDNAMEAILEMAKQNRVKKIFMRLDPLVNPDARHKIYNYNVLMKYGFENQSITSRIVDLRLPESELWTDFSQGTRSRIQQGSKIYSAEWYNAANITFDTFFIYQDMHRRAAGRVTRPTATFDLMLDWILQGNGFLHLLRFENMYMNAVILYCYNGCAYYASSADNPDFDFPKPAGHFAQWSIIGSLKKEGVTHYETGWQQFSQQPYDNPAAKDISISIYKSQFGGYNAPLFRGVLSVAEAG